MQATYSFVFFSRDADVARVLASMLEPLGTCYLEQPEPDLLHVIADGDWPDLALLDFIPADGQPDKLQKATDFARELVSSQPGLTCVAVGSAVDSSSAIAVLRAGIREFVDLDRPDDLIPALERVLAASRVSKAAPEPGPAKRGVLIQGVRPGLGSSTLAVHLGSVLQERVMASHGPSPYAETGHDDDAQTVLGKRVAVLDFGLPVSDGMMYMNASGPFDAGEALRSIERLDHTMLRAAMAYDKTYLSVLSLPRDRAELDRINPRDVAVLCRRLQSVYAAVVADVGGWQDHESITALGTNFSERWLVTDQSIGALVSLADCLHEIKRDGVSADGVFLVVNRYDPRYGLSARQIAERFNITLKGTLPDRTLALRKSANTGQLLHHVAPRDPYIKALQKLLVRTWPEFKRTANAKHNGMWRWFKRSPRHTQTQT